MDTETQESNINEILTYLLDAVKTAEAFTVEQVPLLAQEIITYGIASNTACVIAGSVALWVGMFLGKRGVAENKKPYHEQNEPVIILGIMGGTGLALGGLCVIALSVGDLIKAIFAPRLYLIDYVSNLLN